MKNLKKFFLGFIAVFSFLLATVNFSFAQTPSPEPSPEVTTVNSYELFWPIVAGRVMGESMYSLKSLKEKIREGLIFSNFKKAEYNITLAEKRTIEAERLLVEKKDSVNAKKSLDAAQARRDKTLSLIQKAETEGRYVVDVKNTLVSSLEKQRALLNGLIVKVTDDSKKLLEDNVSALNATLAKLEE